MTAWQKWLVEIIVYAAMFWTGFYLGGNSIEEVDGPGAFQCVVAVFAVTVIFYGGWMEGKQKMFTQQIEDLTEKLNKLTDKRKG